MAAFVKYCQLASDGPKVRSSAISLGIWDFFLAGVKPEHQIEPWSAAIPTICTGKCLP